jgi:hypothetical protein
MNCPYSSMTLKCRSREGIIHQVDRIEFFKRFRGKHNMWMTMHKVVRHKLDFIADRLKNLFFVQQILIPPLYDVNPLDESLAKDESEAESEEISPKSNLEDSKEYKVKND